MSIATNTYLTEITTWRAALEGSLRRDWIGLVGLVELQPGLNQIGSAVTSDVLLPADSAPAYVGVLNTDAGEVSLGVAPGVAVAVNGTPVVGSVRLHADADGQQVPDLVTVGSITFFAIQRGPRTLVRVRDAQSPELALFAGRRWLPVGATYRVEGVFTPYDPPKPLAITNVLGNSSAQTSPGVVTFTLGGRAAAAGRHWLARWRPGAALPRPHQRRSDLRRRAGAGHAAASAWPGGAGL